MRLKQELDNAVENLYDALKNHPERRSDIAAEYVSSGEPRPYPVIHLGRAPDVESGEGMKRVVEKVLPPEERLLEKLKGKIAPLEMLNPINPIMDIGKGTGTLAASFGISLDPELGYTPHGIRAIEDILTGGLPDFENSGVIPEMLEDIEAIKTLTPEWVKIALPDMQGPFNIAHMVLGDAAFYTPFEEPEKFKEFMDIVTDFFIGLHKKLVGFIGEKRLSVLPGWTHRIAECSVNMISQKMYMEHVLPYDMKIANYFGRVGIHPCSGPHVFYATIKNLPNVIFHEAGYIERTAAGSISVDDALREIGSRPVILSIGQELPEGNEKEFIRHDLDRAKENSRLLFGYTGMHWKRKDEEKIRKIHRWLDEYWHDNIWKYSRC